ncbi:hypothetical protein ROZALSC1DRAFT_24222 [Rozella allomycis CSF55]|uniref:Uncharacterized protein n=1 Tax=Rozella allomycis (strain CSF55) TaxID=988480 RepID=A0A4P9YE83_ROZAC|nr:hypothetical protein ROZALSC1DRAFT_24222 [Rozella allomycis CSF55]
MIESSGHSVDGKSSKGEHPLVLAIGKFDNEYENRNITFELPLPVTPTLDEHQTWSRIRNTYNGRDIEMCVHESYFNMYFYKYRFRFTPKANLAYPHKRKDNASYHVACWRVLETYQTKTNIFYALPDTTMLCVKSHIINPKNKTPSTSNTPPSLTAIKHSFYTDGSTSLESQHQSANCPHILKLPLGRGLIPKNALPNLQATTGLNRPESIKLVTRIAHHWFTAIYTLLWPGQSILNTRQGHPHHHNQSRQERPNRPRKPHICTQTGELNIALIQETAKSYIPIQIRINMPPRKMS